LRTGYSFPTGGIGNTINSDYGPSSLSDTIGGLLPIWIDAGYRFSSTLYLGAFFQYGIGFAKCRTDLGERCSANEQMFGIDLHYHFMPGRTFDLWGGVGVGYEILSSTFTASGADGGVTTSESVNGFDFINLQLGVDYKPAPSLGLGPFVLLLSVGQFSNCSYRSFLSGAGPLNCSITNQTLHEWFTIGVRGAYDVALF
jgi:hypothetical protein